MSKHQQMAQWYTRLGQSLDAGIALPEALATINGPGRCKTEAMAGQLRDGMAWDTVLRQAPDWLPEADRWLLSAAAEAGRLPAVCGSLAQRHKRLDENRREWIQALVYPAILVHLSILLGPLFAPTELLNASSGGQSPWLLYLSAVVPGLMALWCGVVGIKVFFHFFPGSLHYLRYVLPGLGGYLDQQSYARFAETLEALLQAGVSVEEAMGGAALVADHPQVQAKVLAVLPEIRRGNAPSGLLKAQKVLPAEYLNLYETGEKTGRLDTNLVEIRQMADRKASDRLRSMRFWYAKLIYAAVALIVVYQALNAMQDYLDQIMSVM